MTAKRKLYREARQKTGYGWKNWRKWVRRFAAEQVDLGEIEAQVLREHLWELYE